MIDSAPNGGHIYQWLGFHVSAFDIARRRGWSEALNLLLRRTRLREQVPESAACHLADAARNNNAAAVKMVRAVQPTAPYVIDPVRWVLGALAVSHAVASSASLTVAQHSLYPASLAFVAPIGQS
jgi:hypothetical protein